MDMAGSQKFCLKWNNFQSSVTSVFDNLRQDEELVDITLCCEGKKIKAHRMMLSACSPYFRDLFKDNPCQHPLFFLKDTSFADMAAVIEFVYKGEVNVLQSQLASFLKTAEMLQVKGLSGDEEDEQNARQSVSKERSRPPPPPAASAPPMRQRAREPPDAPASPLHKRRRVSTSGGSRPGSPGPTAPPPPPPPPMVSVPSNATANSKPPPPPAESAGLLSSSDTTAVRAADYGSIKVEKIDISGEDEDEASLEATLGQVSTFEASQFDGSDHSASSNDMAGLLSRVSEQGAGDMLGAGTSEDGTSQGDGAAAAHWMFSLPAAAAAAAGSSHWLSAAAGSSLSCRPGLQSAATAVPPASAAAMLRRSQPATPGRVRCPDCGRDFTQGSLEHHRASHRGRTTCPVCGTVYGTRPSLRRHVLKRHPDYHQLDRAGFARGHQQEKRNTKEEPM